MKAIMLSLFVALSLSGCACRLEPVLVPVPDPPVEEPPTHVSVCTPIADGVEECSDESMIALVSTTLCRCNKDI